VKLGVVVEGHSEYKALPEICPQLKSACGASMVRLLRADYDPLAPPARIVKACESRIVQLAERGCVAAVVLVDRERRTEKCAAIAQELERAFSDGDFSIPVHVVVKDKCFENWLVADLAALRQLRKRFQISNGMARKVEPDRADRADALALLKQAAKGSAYGKVDDAKRIMEKASIDLMASHSRSFRCFLGRLGDPRFSSGSCQPV
jgi:Domain of unknown function (DUF4276)